MLEKLTSALVAAENQNCSEGWRHWNILGMHGCPAAPIFFSVLCSGPFLFWSVCFQMESSLRKSYFLPCPSLPFILFKLCCPITWISSSLFPLLNYCFCLRSQSNIVRGKMAVPKSFPQVLMSGRQAVRWDHKRESCWTEGNLYRLVVKKKNSLF